MNDQKIEHELERIADALEAIKTRLLEIAGVGLYLGSGILLVAYILSDVLG